MTALPHAGHLVRIDGRASVQFAGDRALLMRVVRVDPRTTYHGWCWLTGYVLDRNGEATERRDVYVQVTGLRPVVDVRQQLARVRSSGGRGRGRRDKDLLPLRLG
ncbi:hypothetical protein C6361_26810 [Plantactinospora sp. BC1]|uniref:hypothetical protein n=1 Tax=Plantactinospora sp. BC1 TaxID=2108470 RepID=UPI000D1636B6|nr:hypothetical protein [Plantactinospora sp. BC1]AVT32474.1 hypothetical protein C6361_26810 [Plantactinospora sp. BC1]